MSAKPTTRFCHYCRLTKPNDGFKFVLHGATGSKRSQCAGCQEVRKKSREEHERMAAAERDLRSKHMSEISRRNAEERRKNVQ